jgi:hypothetical protein
VAATVRNAVRFDQGAVRTATNRIVLPANSTRSEEFGVATGSGLMHSATTRVLPSRFTTYLRRFPCVADSRIAVILSRLVSFRTELVQLQAIMAAR